MFFVMEGCTKQEVWAHKAKQKMCVFQSVHEFLKIGTVGRKIFFVFCSKFLHKKDEETIWSNWEIFWKSPKKSKKIYGLGAKKIGMVGKLA